MEKVRGVAGRTAAPGFAGIASSYDDEFSSTPLGRTLRTAVWRRLDRHVRAGDHALDVGCGTGEDARHLAELGVQVVAVDAVPEMVELARAKTASFGDRVRTYLVDLMNLDDEPACNGPFDAVVSSFGVLNCVSDLGAALLGIAGRLRPGGVAVLSLMGPIVPWEWLWLTVTGRPREALRRLRRDGVVWRGVSVRYPSVRRLRRECPTTLGVRRVAALGVLMPPSYAGEWIGRHPGVLSLLDRVERRLETVPPLPQLADHYLVELERL